MVFEEGEVVHAIVVGYDPGPSNLAFSTAELEEEAGDILHNRQKCWDSKRTWLGWDGGWDRVRVPRWAVLFLQRFWAQAVVRSLCPPIAQSCRNAHASAERMRERFMDQAEPEVAEQVLMPQVSAVLWEF